jgi:hypothetical protein
MIEKTFITLREAATRLPDAERRSCYVRDYFPSIYLWGFSFYFLLLSFYFLNENQH